MTERVDRTRLVIGALLAASVIAVALAPFPVSFPIDAAPLALLVGALAFALYNRQFDVATVHAPYYRASQEVPFVFGFFLVGPWWAAAALAAAGLLANAFVSRVRPAMVVYRFARMVLGLVIAGQIGEWIHPSGPPDTNSGLAAAIAISASIAVYAALLVPLSNWIRVGEWRFELSRHDLYGALVVGPRLLVTLARLELLLCRYDPH